MSFTSIHFIFIFLPVALAGFQIGRKRGWADLWLIGVSLVFYSMSGITAMFVVAGSAVANYFISIRLSRTAELHRRAIFTAAVVGNLLVLGYFKYFSAAVRFFASTLHQGLSVSDIPLSLGVSFFTFQQIAYLIDIKTKQSPAPTFRNYLLFVTFFPQAASGPINYWHETIPQYEVLKRGSVDFSVGLTMFAFGLFKKTVLASPLAQFIDPVFDGSPGSLGFVAAWTGAIANALYLYLDFSGYTDMALGLARMFGIRLPTNFNSPLKASNLVDFWRRWHMTMTRLFTDYVYSPLALSWTRQSILRREGRVRQFLKGVAVPSTITLIIIGWWHGPRWTYIVFGAVHAVGLILNHSWRQLKWPAPPRIVGWALTFSFFILTQVIFRAPTMAQANSVYHAMAGAGFSTTDILHQVEGSWRNPTAQDVIPFPFLPMLSRLTHAPELTIFIAALFLLCTVMPNTLEVLSRYRPALTGLNRNYAGFIRWRPTTAWSIVIAALTVLAILNISHVRPFIYVRF